MSGTFPEVRYADADGTAIAYCVRGDAPRALIRVPDIMSSILVSVVDPWVDAFNELLSRFARLIRLDRRGLGMSDPLASDDVPPLEQQVDDVLAVMDAVGVCQAALGGSGDGAQVALMFAATHPERVSALILNNAWARAFRAPHYPIGPDPASREQRRLQMLANWGDLDRPWGLESFAPSRRDDPTLPQLLARRQQVSASPGAAAAMYLNEGNDVREVLPFVHAPTLVLCPSGCHPRAESLQLIDHAQYLAEHLPNARLARLPGVDSYAGPGVPERAAIIEEFLTGTRPAPLGDRVLATVLFTDIVASTERVASRGDEAWRADLDRHDAMVRTQFQRFRGREVSAAGDGFFAVFDGPARAVRCAQAISEGAEAIGLGVRAGVHVGECEVRGDDLAGIAVHIGARVCALARPGEVLATSTVRDLVAGSGITFTERGTRTLRGVPGEWRVLAAES